MKTEWTPQMMQVLRITAAYARAGRSRRVAPASEQPLLALKRPAVAPAEGLLTQAVLKHRRVAQRRCAR
jgi:hypothetical protein